MSPSHIPVRQRQTKNKRKPMQGWKCTKGKTVRADRSSRFCLLDIPLKKLACPCVHHPILPARSTPEGQFPCLAPEAFSSISLGFRTWCAGLFCHFGNRHYYCYSGFKAISVKLVFGLGKRERERRREKGWLCASGKR